jgi:hypothetical protein
MKMKKSELREMIKEVLEEEFSTRKNLKEAAFDSAVNNIDESGIDESAIDDCLARIEANSGSRSEDWATVRLSKEDLKKALKIGTNVSHGANWGTTIPAQIVDSADLVLLYSNYDKVATISLELHGDTREETGLSVNEYIDDCIPIIDCIELECSSEDEATSYFKNEILPKADEVAHNIIQKAWIDGKFNDYSGITDYNSNLN